MNRPEPTVREVPAADTRRLDNVLSGLLRLGVWLSIILLASGVCVSLLRHPNYMTDAGALARLTEPGAAFPSTLQSLGVELRQGRGRAVMTLGLLVLIATPVLRVAASVVAFVLTRDGWYVVVTSVVMLVLILSVCLGRAG